MFVHPLAVDAKQMSRYIGFCETINRWVYFPKFKRKFDIAKAFVSGHAAGLETTKPKAYWILTLKLD